MGSTTRIMAIANKEVKHVFSDSVIFHLIITVPLAYLLVFGSVIEFNAKDIVTSINDMDKSSSSRKLLEILSSSKYFTLDQTIDPENSSEALINNKARAALIIPPDFQKNILKGDVGDVQVLLDGTDSSTVIPILGYLSDIQEISNREIADNNVDDFYNISFRFLFNPELDSKWFAVPGIAVVICSFLYVILTAISTSVEFEKGTIEIILSAPVRPIEIVVGKLIPYFIIGFLMITIFFAVLLTYFQIPFRGDFRAYVIGFVLFALCYLSLGLLISIKTKNQRLSIQLAMMAGTLPAILLSGFIFPISSMPIFFQYVSTLVPARWFIEITRATFLQGATLEELYKPILALGLFAFFVLYRCVSACKRELA